jgi:hypothetical protein
MNLLSIITHKTVTCSALDFISLLVPHIPPKRLQMVRYAGLYTGNLKHKIAPILLASLEALRLQFPLSRADFIPRLF